MISGVGWVVRNGKSYITENISPLRDAENISSTFGNFYSGTFPPKMSSKSMIGYDKYGKLMILQIDGIPGVDGSGMNLFELSDFAVELGFYSGINLISVPNMVQNGTTVSLATETCLSTNLSSTGAPYYKCPGVHGGTYACVHSVPTPNPSPSPSSSSSHFSPHHTTQPTTSISASTSSPPNYSPSSSSSYTYPTHKPTHPHHPQTAPGSDSGKYPKPYSPNPSNNYNNNDDEKPIDDSTGLNGLTGNGTLYSTFQTLKTSANFYKETSEILFLLLIVSVVINIIIFAKLRKDSKFSKSLVLDGYGKINFIILFLFLFFCFFIFLFFYFFIFLFFCFFIFLFFCFSYNLNF